MAFAPGMHEKGTLMQPGNAPGGKRPAPFQKASGKKAGRKKAGKNPFAKKVSGRR